MVRFVDLLYGHVEVPEWLVPFIKLPEFVRLRGVRLSNVDSFYFKDFAAPSRWEHGIAVAALAHRCCLRRGLSLNERVTVVVAALLHDVGTPPFAHTAEAVLANFDHELAGQQVLGFQTVWERPPDTPIFESQLAQFQRACEQLGRRLKVRVDPDEIARCVVGEGELGFLINGSVDLDNADNVTRASLFLGQEVTGEVPLGVADWLAVQDGVVTELGEVVNEAVQKWLVYRERLYTAFFDADGEELARTAFLQHLMRRALDAGLEREYLVRATDDELIRRIGAMDDLGAEDFRAGLSELVQRYRLLEAPVCIANVPLVDDATLGTLRHPDAVAWMTRHLRTERLEPMLLVMSRRFGTGSTQSLLPEAVGTLLVFHLGSRGGSRELVRKLLELRGGGAERRKRGGGEANRVLSKCLEEWKQEKPWLVENRHRRRNVKAALEDVGDWGFRLSRNDCFHVYPSTFVHAIPANLLVALGVRGDRVLDPYGGTGQTALEAIKYGNDAVIGDVNTIACLAAKARLTFIGRENRERLRQLSAEQLMACEPAEVPTMELLEEWFHPDTVQELARILGHIDARRSSVLQVALKACFSAILPSCTGRRGEQHGYFADNCPLSKGVDGPPYQPAAELFLERVRKLLRGAERLYGVLARQGRAAATELARVDVRQVDVARAVPASYGLQEESVGAVVTSPPYLCMADYALGQRLSYEWLAPTLLEEDFEREMGARRMRFRRDGDGSTVGAYMEGLGAFAKLARRVVRRGGFVAVVLGQPVAKKYRDVGVVEHLDVAMEEQGFERIWAVERRISWHRNHGYARLKTERISVHTRA